MEEAVEQVQKAEAAKAAAAKVKAARKKAIDKANEESKKVIKRADEYALKTKKYYNQFDGTFHMPDGSREFMDETKVEGVNNYHQ